MGMNINVSFVGSRVHLHFYFGAGSGWMVFYILLRLVYLFNYVINA